MNLKHLQLAEKQVEHLLKILKIESRVKSQAAVFFDIDGTINRNDCLELLVSEIMRRGLLKDSKKEIYEKQHQLWKSRELAFEDYLKVIIELVACLKFFSRDILKKIAQDVIRDHGSYYYLFPWMLLLKLKSLGYKLIAVSGAPSFMARMYLNKIGLFPWEINGSDYIIKDHVFTGEVDLSILKNKGEFIEKKYKDVFDLEQSIALGDSIGDIPMFQKIGKKIAVNPTFALAAEAKKNKWPVVVERKDLILIFPQGQLDI